MSSVSRLSEKCRKCPNVKKCNNKRIEACAYMEMPKKLLSGCSTSLTSKLVAPTARTCTPITIKMGEHGNINTSLEEIQKQAEQKIYRALQVPSCILNGGK